MEENGTFLNSFYEASHTLKLELDRWYSIIALMNTDTHIFSKILANGIQQYIKRII